MGIPDTIADVVRNQAKADAEAALRKEPGRRRAGALKSADAGPLIRAKFPFVYQQMTPAQLDQVQRLLDAAVVNPVVQKEAADIEWVASRDTMYTSTGAVTYRDPTAASRIQKAKNELIPIKEADHYVRLDFENLLAPDALKPKTNNPDEAAYLQDVKEALAKNGVWLWVRMGMVADEPGRPSTRRFDPRTFECSLLYGFRGEPFKDAPSTGGRLTRDVLFSVAALGAGYYDAVWKGPVMTMLERGTSRLLLEIQAGRQQHFEIARIRRRAVPGTVWVADKVGGADFPDETIWDEPHTLVVQAMHLQASGNVQRSQAYLLVAAVLTRNAARQLNQYIDGFTSGGAGAVKVLHVLKTAGEVAEIGLAIAGVGGIVRGAAGAAGVGAAAGGSVDAEAEQLLRQYLAKNPGLAEDLAQVRSVPGPPGSVAGRIKAGHSAGAGTGWHKW
jgi:hypothetical protein